MIITIESISKIPNQPDRMIEDDYTYYRGDYLNSHCNVIRCRIDKNIDDEMYSLPKESIWLNDVIGFSNTMIKHQKYDCVLEIESFSKVELNTNHNYSIRGVWRKKVPVKYLPKYSLFKEQSCIEIEEDIILISPYNNSCSLSDISDGAFTEIIFESNLNIKYAQLIGS